MALLAPVFCILSSLSFGPPRVSFWRQIINGKHLLRESLLIRAINHFQHNTKNRQRRETRREEKKKKFRDEKRKILGIMLPQGEIVRRDKREMCSTNRSFMHWALCVPTVSTMSFP